MRVNTSPNRKTHWIKPNEQNRIPPRWVAFDTESKSNSLDNLEIQTWSLGAAIRWRFGLKSGDRREHAIFNTPRELWEWVSDYTRPETRTVCVAHNLGHDVRISDALEILPTLGFQLEWCNLDSNVSSMTWRSDHGTLVFSDLWTWLPVKLQNIGLAVKLPKLDMPRPNASADKWKRYCLRDAEIVYEAVSELTDYIRKENLGNWQPTGAGMAYATWRHKFLTHKPLVHDDLDILSAEREAMYTGRAEAWRHGTFLGDTWTEVDMRNAYVTIASECDLPTKVKYSTGRITNDQYCKLSNSYRCLVYASVGTASPTLPCRVDGRTIWPVGSYKGWYWDTEIDLALECGAEIAILNCICYTRKPVLAAWANWVLDILRCDDGSVSPVVQTWAKHCARALIGRISLRTPSWEHYASNLSGDTGITMETNSETGETYRLMAVGDKIFRESMRTECDESLPQITGWIMAECRVRLFRAMTIAGGENIAHVDTDSILCNAVGLARLRDTLGADLSRYWQIKASYRRLTVYGPRNYRPGALRKTAGVPKGAKESEPNVFMGECWHGISTDLQHGRPDSVTVATQQYRLKASDPRRSDAPGAAGRTVALTVYQSSSSATAPSGIGTSGA